MLVLDPRLDQIKKIIEALVTKTLQFTVRVLVNEGNQLVFTVDNTLMYVVPLVNEQLYPPFAFNYIKFMEATDNREDIDFNVESFDIAELSIYNELSSLYNSYATITANYPVIACNVDLKNAEDFAGYLNIKADNGMKYYKLPGVEPGKSYPIPIFASFPNIASQDKLGISMNRIDNRFLLCRFDIFKKKINRNINVLFRLLDLSGEV